MTGANQVMNMNTVTIKILLAGSGCVGKTSFLNNLRNLPHDRKYNSTYRLETTTVRIGNLNCIIYDTEGQAFTFLDRDDNEYKLYKSVDCAIFFYSTSNTLTLKDLKTKIKKYKTAKKEIDSLPIFMVYGLRIDESDRKINPNIVRQKLGNVYQMEGSNLIQGSARNVFIIMLTFLYQTILSTVQTYDSSVSDDILQYMYPYWKKLQEIITSDVTPAIHNFH